MYSVTQIGARRGDGEAGEVARYASVRVLPPAVAVRQAAGGASRRVAAADARPVEGIAAEGQPHEGLLRFTAGGVTDDVAASAGEALHLDRLLAVLRGRPDVERELLPQ
jgi:hypothetical protein